MSTSFDMTQNYYTTKLPLAVMVNEHQKVKINPKLQQQHIFMYQVCIYTVTGVHSTQDLPGNMVTRNRGIYTFLC